MWRIIVLVCAALLSAPCAADTGSLTLENYRKGNGAYDAYFDGVKEGVIAMLAAMSNESRRACLPGRLAITRAQAEDIMLRYAETHQVSPVARQRE